MEEHKLYALFYKFNLLYNLTDKKYYKKLYKELFLEIDVLMDNLIKIKFKGYDPSYIISDLKIFCSAINQEQKTIINFIIDKYKLMETICSKINSFYESKKLDNAKDFVIKLNDEFDIKVYYSTINKNYINIIEGITDVVEIIDDIYINTENITRDNISELTKILFN